jgi:hypothetical protein
VIDLMDALQRSLGRRKDTAEGKAKRQAGRKELAKASKRASEASSKPRSGLSRGAPLDYVASLSVSSPRERATRSTLNYSVKSTEFIPHSLVNVLGLLVSQRAGSHQRGGTAFA